VRGRLFYKIFASYLVLVVLVMAVMEFFLTPKIRETITQNVRERMIGQGRIMVLLPLEELVKKTADLAAGAQARITVIDAAGRVLADSSRQDQKWDNHLNRSEVQEARIRGLGAAVRYSRTLGRNMLYIAVAVGREGEIRGYVRLACSLADVSASIDHLYRSIYLTLFIIALPSLVLAFFFSRGIAAPIRRMTEFTEKIRSGERPAPLLADGEDELGKLTKDINAMLAEQEEKIRLATEEKSKLEAAFAGMVEGVLTLDRANHIDQFNRSLRKMIGRRQDEIRGKTLLEVFHSAALREAFLRFRETGKPLTAEITVGDERPLALEVNISAIAGLPADEGKIMMVFHNVTRLKQLERMRMDFVANVTHEIRTPLTAIIGYVETLLQGAASQDARQREKFLQTIQANAQRLNRLVDDLLTLSNIETGEIRLHRESVAPDELIAEALKTIQPRLEGKKIKSFTRIPPHIPPLWVDRDRAVQVLLNILDNAVKYTPAGGRITVSATVQTELREELTEKGGPGVGVETKAAGRDRFTGEDEAAATRNGGPEAFVAIIIADTGPGVPKLELPRLGERFYRVDKTRSRELGGTGLGLSIVKHLMAAHGGRLEIDSAPGQGTTVALFFPTVKNQ